VAVGVQRASHPIVVVGGQQQLGWVRPAQAAAAACRQQEVLQGLADARGATHAVQPLIQAILIRRAHVAGSNARRCTLLNCRVLGWKECAGRSASRFWQGSGVIKRLMLASLRGQAQCCSCALYNS
jgi:hypothetical protein